MKKTFECEVITLRILKLKISGNRRKGNEEVILWQS